MLGNKLGELGISKELQNINKDDLLVLCDFNSFQNSAQIVINSTLLNIETTYPLKTSLSNAVRSLFNSERWNKLNRSAVLAVKNRKAENLIFQHLPVKDKINHPRKNKRLEEIH